jgi:hypothetical protein
MSLSTGTFRALSSPRITGQLAAKPSTFLPFLYQTTTIQQRRGIGSKFDSNDDPIAFLEGQSKSNTHPPTGEQRQRPSTITNTERKAFEKLLSLQGQDKPLENDIPVVSGADDFANKHDPLSTMFDNVLRKNGRAVGMTPGRGSKALDISKVAESIIGSYEDRSIALNTEEADRLRKVEKLQEEQNSKITALLSAAKTDTELWSVLDTEVFTLVKNLDLDGTTKKAQPKSKKKAKATKGEKAEPTSASTLHWAAPKTKIDATSVAVIGPIFPVLLVTAVRQLRQDFPRSSLPLNLIPTVKALGRGAYVLGASTALYNELIAMAWIKYADLQYVEELIQDMDNGGVDFDVNTLEMLDAINAEGQEARNQAYGQIVAAVWSLDRFVGGWAKLQRWRDVMKERLHADALRKADLRQIAHV